MKFIDISVTLLMISFAVTLFANTHIFPDVGGMRLHTKVLDPINPDTGENQDLESFAAKYANFGKDTVYLNALMGSDSLSYLQGGGDFPRGLFYTYDTFVKGPILVKPTLDALYVKGWLMWIIITPVYLMYALAIIQIVSKQGFESNT